jgi:hypothetical protein
MKKEKYKGLVKQSNEHWVKDVSDSVFPEYKDTPKDAFMAGNGSIRPQPHKKINECDH